MRGGAALAALLAAAALAGCADSISNTTVGPTLSVYSILPLQGPRAGQTADIVDGEKLALRDAGGAAGGRIVNFRSVDSSAQGAVTPGSAAAAARLAAQDPSSIAAVGALTGEEGRVVLPLVNEAGMPIVTPAATYAGLSRAIPGVTATGEPDRLFPSGRHAFARVIGSDVTQAPALAALARRSGCRTLNVVAGPTADDAALAAQVGQAIPGRSSFGLGTAAQAGTGCLLLASGEPAVAARAARAAHARTILAPAPLLDPAFTRALGPAAARTRLLSPVPAPRYLPPDAARVAGDFRRAFGRPATAWSLLGYDAMAAILDAIRRAGAKGDDRNAVARGLLASASRAGVLGPSVFDAAGDPVRFRWAAAAVRAGAPVAGKPLE